MLRIIRWNYSIFLSANQKGREVSIGTVHSPLSLQSTNFLQFYTPSSHRPLPALGLSAAWCQWRSSIGKLKPSRTFFSANAVHVMKSCYPFCQSFVHPTLTMPNCLKFKYIWGPPLVCERGVIRHSAGKHRINFSGGQDATWLVISSPPPATRTLANGTVVSCSGNHCHH